MFDDLACAMGSVFCRKRLMGAVVYFASVLHLHHHDLRTLFLMHVPPPFPLTPRTMICAPHFLTHGPLQ